MNKPKVEVISPAGACDCSFSVWIGKVWDILTEYKDKLEIESLTSDSQRAQDLGVGSRTVVVNGEAIPLFLLKEKVHELLDRDE